MLVFFKSRLALLAMPKTGSTALETAFGGYADIQFSGEPRNKHMPLRKFERFMRPYLSTLELDQIETACAMREPMAWLGSWYRYRARAALNGHANSTAGLSFETFVQDYMHPDPPPHAQIGSQARFVTNKSGAVGVDHLYAYEDFGSFTGFLSARLGQRIEPARVNASPDMDIGLSTGTAQALRAHLAPEYAIYDRIKRSRSSDL